ncbi:beta-lactamase-like protein [Aspergillus unguis]
MPGQDSDPEYLDLLICSTCGTQFPETSTSTLTACKICDDPRQFVPPTGQSWTTLRKLRDNSDGEGEPHYKNIFTPDPIHGEKLVSIHTEPRFAIGQRAYLCRTSAPTGGGDTFNVLWDCIAYIDEDTVNEIKRLGGIQAIVISHPHYYTTHLVWAEIFGCPVYLSAEDEEWVVLRDSHGGFSGNRQVLFTEKELTFGPEMSGSGASEGDLVAIKTGGHFPGSTVLWWRSLKTLLIADTIAVVPSARYWVGRPAGTASFTFMWSYPNMIPLTADDVHEIWNAVKHTDFEITRGAFIGMDTNVDSKKRFLDSAQIFVRAMGYLDHAIHKEECL